MKDRKIMKKSEGDKIKEKKKQMNEGERGKIMMKDYKIIEKIQKKKSERIKESEVNEKGWGD